MGVKKSFLLMNFYLGGMDCPIPREKTDEAYLKALRSIERNVNNIQRIIGDDQRKKNIKS